MAAKKKSNTNQLSQTTLIALIVVGVVLIAAGWFMYQKSRNAAVDLPIEDGHELSPEEIEAHDGEYQVQNETPESVIPAPAEAP